MATEKDRVGAKLKEKLRAKLKEKVIVRGGLVSLLLFLLTLAGVPYAGWLGGGLSGGLVAGYLAKEELMWDACNGLLAGVLGGFLNAVFITIVSIVDGTLEISVILMLFVAVLTFLRIFPLGGFIGGILGGAIGSSVTALRKK